MPCRIIEDALPCQGILDYEPKKYPKRGQLDICVYGFTFNAV
jgi:hypothetical protein